MPWETLAWLWNGGCHSGTGRRRSRHLCRRPPCLVLRGGAQSGAAVLPYRGPACAPKKPGVCQDTTLLVPLREPPHGNSHGTVPWRTPRREESLHCLGEQWRLSSGMTKIESFENIGLRAAPTPMWAHFYYMCLAPRAIKIKKYLKIACS